MEAFKSFINWLSGPTVLFTLATIGFFLSLKYTQVWTRKVAYIVGAIMVAFYLFSLTDSDFVAIVAKPDNVPITFVLFLVAFFTWYALHQGVENDKRIALGEPPLEKQEEEKVWVWPDLVLWLPGLLAN